MAEYNFREVEKKWQQKWAQNGTYKTEIKEDKPKFYSLDMFPYPSGAGLHVGHPLGYIASDIVSRFKRLKGFNVLHPMGFDAFGLPAEQYAIQTGQHPAITTEQNIARYKEQLKKIGFCFDWDREVQTCDPSYYKWTQWIFMQLFNSWYNTSTEKAEPIESLIAYLEKSGNDKLTAACDEETPSISASDWAAFSENEKIEFLLKYRLAYLAEMTVNWCPALGTVLSNDEVKDGFSERGGHPVEKKKMMQWMMRITAYANRLLEGLDTIDWPEPLKDMQRNWIGRSYGAELKFDVADHDLEIKVFTTRIDTIFGVTYMALAPESEMVDIITTEAQREEVKAYVEKAVNRSERDRMSDVKTVSGVFTGAYAINPFNGEKIQIWVADYVLAGYGTGAVMAVPAHDSRDYAFAKHFGLEIRPVVEGGNLEEEAFDAKEGKVINSDFLNGLEVKEAIQKAIAFVDEKKIGRGKIQFRMRDAIFARQRYWGEPIPVYFDNDVPHLMDEKELPLVLPEVDAYLPTADGAPPLGRAKNWETAGGYPIEMSTMPGWAGSSWYFYRYMDAKNNTAFADRKALDYWQDVDLYIGGSEHATGHLLYARFWAKFLFDRGFAPKEEPFKKLVNQGMIQGRSNYVYRVSGQNTFVSHGLKDQYDTASMHVDVALCDNDILDIEGFKMWRTDLANAEFILEDGKYICGAEVEKMSKSKYNVVTPDDIIESYGADTLRMYEMFLGPLEQSKPWNTNGIDGVYKFLRKFWRMLIDDKGELQLSNEAPSKDEMRVLHKTLKKIEEDVDRLSLNTSVSTFMIAVNELTALKCNKREILEPLTIALSPFAPHISEEIWSKLGHTDSINDATYPTWDEKYMVQDSIEYPIAINGKMRMKMEFAADTPAKEVEEAVLASADLQKWLEGKTPRKIIVVPKKIVNIVI
ncbi:leucine--tRNA ligase [Fulvivirgaceae bacterium LMO-SS25]